MRFKKSNTLSAILTLVIGTVIGLALAEIMVRVIRPGMYSSPTLYVVGEERVRPLSEIVSFLRTRDDTSWYGPGTQIKPNLYFKGCYDRPSWNYFDKDGCVDYRINRFGFRDNDFALEKAPNELRILAIGDSFTHGVGVQMEDCWVQVLERKLQERRGEHVEVINGGFALGYRPEHYLDWLKTDGLLFDPEAVILGFYLNDMGDIPLVAASSPGQDPGPSKLLSYLRSVLKEQRRRNQGEGEPWDFSEYISRYPEVWETNQRALREIKGILDANRVRFIVAIFPTLSGLNGVYHYRGLHEMVREFFQSEGIEVVDLMDRFIGQNDADLWVHPTDQHPNDVAHEILGEGIFDYLMTTGQ